jgi:putative membrane protein
MLGTSLAGLPAFLVYFCVAAAIVVAYLFIYTRITPHDNVPAAAVALGLSLLGFVLPVASAIAHSANIVDCVVWSIVALVVQVIAYFVAQVVDPHLSKRIAGGELASAIWLGFVSVTFGVLSAASMSS